MQTLITLMVGNEDVSIKVAAFKIFNEGFVSPKAIWNIKEPCDTPHMLSANINSDSLFFCGSVL